MNDYIDLISSVPGMLDNDTIQNIIKVIELSNCKGRDGKFTSIVYCTQTKDSKNNNSLGIHVSFKSIGE